MGTRSSSLRHRPAGDDSDFYGLAGDGPSSLGRRNFRWKLSTKQVPLTRCFIMFLLIGKVKYSNNLWFVLKVSYCILENMCTKKVSEGLGRQIKLILHVPLAFAGSEFYPPWN